jgi:hypothetical protein
LEKKRMKNLSALYALFAINCNKKHMEHVIASETKQADSHFRITQPPLSFRREVGGEV